MKLSLAIKKRIYELRELASTSKNCTRVYFTVGNTRISGKSLYYLTPIRKGVNFYVSGIIVFSESEASIVFECLDGEVDRIFVDIEKKSILKNANGLFNLERLSVEKVLKTPISYFKGNDLTVDAITKTLKKIFKTNNKLFSGSKILLIGAGNIGFKIALRLTESGSSISILNRTFTKAKKIADIINLIKPPETIASPRVFSYHKIAQLAKSKFDIIILTHLSTDSGLTSLYKNLAANESCYVIDVGKGCLTSTQLDLLIQRNINILRLDIGDQLIDFICAETEKSDNSDFILEKRVINGLTLISKGMVGRKNEVVVDDPMNPKIIYGVCDGKGSFVRKSSGEIKLIKLKL